MPTLLVWVAIAVGPRVGRLVVAQLLGVLLVYGLSTRLVDPLLLALSEERPARIATLFVATAVLALFVRPGRECLFPVSLGALRRQPLSASSLWLAWLPWSVLLAWPLPALIAFGHLSWMIVLSTALVAGFGLLLVISNSANTNRRTSRFACIRRIVWPGMLFSVLVLIDWHPVLAPWLAVAIMLVVVFDRAPQIHMALRSSGNDASRRYSACPADTAAGALSQDDTRSTMADRTSTRSMRLRKCLARWSITAHWQRDLVILLHRPRWLTAYGWSMVGLAFLIVIGPAGNANCRGECPGTASLVLVAATLPVCLAVIGTLCDGLGIRLFVPERFVTTRSRLMSLSGVLLIVQLPVLVASLLYSADVAVMPLGFLIISLTLLQQSRKPTRPLQIGPLLWWMLIPLASLTLASEWRLTVLCLMSVLSIVLLDRSAASLRRQIAAGRWRTMANVRGSVT